MISSTEIVEKTNIRRDELTVWHKHGLIPKPRKKRALGGLGTCSYWEDSVFGICVRIKECRKDGYSLDIIKGFGLKGTEAVYSTEELKKELAIKNKTLVLMAEDLKSVVVTENEGKVEYILEHYIERAGEELGL